MNLTTQDLPLSRRAMAEVDWIAVERHGRAIGLVLLARALRCAGSWLVQRVLALLHRRQRLVR
jgi:hypothetical protein